MVDKKADKKKVTAKDRHTSNILEYLANPDNKACTRTKLAQDVCHITIQAFYKIFTSDELSEIEDKALKLRRSRYATKLAMIDAAMIKKACAGSEKAAELCYKRLENWNPNKPVEVDIDGGEQTVKLTFEVVDGRKGN